MIIVIWPWQHIFLSTPSRLKMWRNIMAKQEMSFNEYRKINGKLETSIFMQYTARTIAAMQVADLNLNFSTIWLCGVFYTDTVALHPYEPIGCFKDVRYERALPKWINYHPRMINETDLANSLAAIIETCATEVYNKGFWYFGVEYRSECWSGVNGDMTYNRHGPSDNCLSAYGVGAEWTIFVYRFAEG